MVNALLPQLHAQPERLGASTTKDAFALNLNAPLSEPTANQCSLINLLIHVNADAHQTLQTLAQMKQIHLMQMQNSISTVFHLFVHAKRNQEIAAVWLCTMTQQLRNVFADPKFAVMMKSLTTQNVFADANPNNAQLVCSGVKTNATADARSLILIAAQINTLTTIFVNVFAQKQELLQMQKTTSGVIITALSYAHQKTSTLLTMQMNISTLTPADGSAILKIALLVSSSELAMTVQVAHVYAFPMNVLKVNTGITIPAAATASKKPAQ